MEGENIKLWAQKKKQKRKAKPEPKKSPSVG
jgi:hypothetical protein